MAGVANLRPITVPPGTIEVRVHGVSGTPAEGLLRTSAVLVAGTPTSGFSRHTAQTAPLEPTDPGIIEAYTWGGLTSGTRITSALRLLMLPFALVNVAGWMLPGTTADDGAPAPPSSPSSGGRVAAHQTLARLLALGLTVYAVLGAYWIAAIALERLPRAVDWWPVAAEPWRAFATLAVSCVLIALWSLISRRKARVPTGRSVPTLGDEDEQQLATAPASATSGKASVLSLFSYPATTRHLSRIHALAGTGVAVILVSRDLGGGGAHGALLAVGAALALAALVMLLLFSLRNVVLEGSRPVITTAVVWIVIAAAVGYAFVVAGSAAFAGARLARASTTFGTAILLVAVVAVVLAVAQWVFAPRGGPRWTRLYAGAFTTVAYGTAITAVAGGSVLVNRALDGPESVVSPSGFTYTVAIVGLVSVCAALIAVLLNWPNALRLGSAAWFRGLRATTARARDAILWGAGVFILCAVGLTASAVTARVRGLEPTDLIAHPVTDGLGWASWGWVILAALPAAAIASSVAAGWRRAGLLVLGTAVIVGIAVLAGTLYARTRPGAAAVEWSAWLEDADRALAELAIWAAFIAPLAAVGVFIVRGSRDATTRRMVGVLWDLISYWPRHFHPWAPAPYTDTTIPELADRTAHLLKSSGASRVIISAHSQGAIVAVPAVEALRASGVPASRVALLTYGQLLDSHYRWLFPWVFNPDLFHLVDDYLDGRWINLYRTTDPLGQPVAALPDNRNRVNDGGLELDLGPTSKPKVLNHSDYWYGEAYQPALDDLGGH